MWEEQFAGLANTAIRHNGLITAAQAARLGVDDATLAHFAAVGLLQELDWSVYRLATSSYGDRYAFPYAAWLALRPELFRWERPEAPEADAVLSHESACGVLGIGTVRPTGMRFVAPSEQRSPAAITVAPTTLAPHEVMLYEGIPVTTPHRTILDLIAEWTPRDDIAGVCLDAVRRDLVRLRALYEDVLDIADTYGLPTGGKHFFDYFLPGVWSGLLSTANLRDFAEIGYPAQVAEVRPAVDRIIYHLRVDSGPVDGDLGAEIAAEIVGRNAAR